MSKNFHKSAERLARHLAKTSTNREARRLHMWLANSLLLAKKLSSINPTCNGQNVSSLIHAKFDTESAWIKLRDRINSATTKQ